MHSATNFAKIGATTIKHLAMHDKLNTIIFINENDSELKVVAETLFTEKLFEINFGIL